MKSEVADSADTAESQWNRSQTQAEEGESVDTTVQPLADSYEHGILKIGEVSCNLVKQCKHHSLLVHDERLEAGDIELQ